jgi:hypothetical protein
MGLDESVSPDHTKISLLATSDGFWYSVFALTMPTEEQEELELPPELLVSIALFSSSKEEFKTMVKKEKLPKPRLVEPVVHRLLEILERREAAYTTTIEVCLSIDSERL